MLYMTHVLEKQMAIKLRQKGKSLSNIAKQLFVSKSTVSLWCQKIILTRTQLEVLARNTLKGQEKGRKKSAESKRAHKINTIETFKKEGIENIAKLTDRELLIAGVGLYWGEGSKKFKLSFINSDPVLIKFMFIWFQRIFNLKKEDFMPRIFINQSHQYRVDTVVSFWAHELGLPKSQFGKVTLLRIKSKKIYPNHNTYYGVLALRIRRGTKNLYRMLGLIEGLKRGI